MSWKWIVPAFFGLVIGAWSCGPDHGSATGPACESDDQCEDGWFCDTLDTGHCKKIQCESDEECRESQFCDTQNTHTCHSKSCSDNADCPLMWLCDKDSGNCYDPDPNTDSCQVPVPGCPCSSLGAGVGCRPAGQDVRLDGSCHQSEMICDGERWGACEDHYNKYCDGVDIGSDAMHPDEDNSQNVDKNLEGALVLVPDEKHVEFGYAWIANSGENTVSKLDVETGHEVARYPSIMEGVAGVPTPALPYPATHPYNDCQNCPSRTAIDFHGDAYVANRAFGMQGSVTKFANKLEDCIDRNGDGEITTSQDLNGDGVIDVTDPNEFPGYDDECLIWTVPVGNNNGVPRALAIDAGNDPDLSPEGNVWVGLYSEQRALQLNGQDGSVAKTVNLGSVHPYGAAVGPGGRVWFTSITDGTMAEVDAFFGDLVREVNVAQGTGCNGAYGIAVDVNGRIWLGGWQCNTGIRFDPATDEFATIDFSGLGRGDTTRGIAPDLEGTVWIAHTAGWVSRFDADSMQEVGAWQIQNHIAGELVDNTIGVGIDRNGACWVVSRNDDYDQGTATRILADGTQDSFPVGLYPYTYSDFTGFGMVTVVRPSGWYNMIVSGCEEPDPPTNWQTLGWSENEPPGTSVRLRIKVADSIDDLANASWFGPFDTSPVDLDAAGVPDSRFMLVQVVLVSSDPQVTPAFSGFYLDFPPCGGDQPPNS